jgi:hypothetical protein
MGHGRRTTPHGVPEFDEPLTKQTSGIFNGCGDRSRANDRERPRIFSQMKIPGNRGWVNRAWRPAPHRGVGTRQQETTRQQKRARHKIPCRGCAAWSAVSPGGSLAGVNFGFGMDTTARPTNPPPPTLADGKRINSAAAKIRSDPKRYAPSISRMTWASRADKSGYAASAPTSVV